MKKFNKGRLIKFISRAYPEGCYYYSGNWSTTNNLYKARLFKRKLDIRRISNALRRQPERLIGYRVKVVECSQERPIFDMIQIMKM